MRELAWFTPWPPKANGIADYAFRVARELSKTHRIVAYTDMPSPILPPDAVCRSFDECASLSGDVCPIYQIGNNFDHISVFRKALRYPGLVVLHDLSLLYLVENAGFDPETLFDELVKSNPIFAPLRARAIASGHGSYKSDHSLFRMVHTLVETARAVVVHTHYAKNVLVRTVGAHVARRIHVIPHFAISPTIRSGQEERARLSIPPDAFVVVTSGFATAAKRFDWLIEALRRVSNNYRRIMWVQAGPTRAEEYDLQGLVAKFPEVARITRFTEYLSEELLDTYIAVADLFVNLRYPSVGESSGSLARAFSAGVACVVTDTAGYREIPDSAVFKVSPRTASRDIETILVKGMIDPQQINEKRAAAVEYAQNYLSIEHYIAKFVRVIEEASTATSSIGDEQSVIMSTHPTRYGPFNLGDLTFGLLAPQSLQKGPKDGLRVRKHGAQWYLEVVGET